MTILERVIQDIKQVKNVSHLWLTDFYVCSPFTVVKLSDGSIGSAGNYNVQNHTSNYDPLEIKGKYKQHLNFDPLLLQTLCDDHSLVGLSLQTAIVSALSQSLLKRPVLCTFGLECYFVDNSFQIIENYIKDGDTVALIGFGGALETFCTSDQIKHLYVCDLTFSEQKYREIAWQHIRSIGADESRITLTDGTQSHHIIPTSDICFITGSALCNGTMEKLLALAAGCREIIVQGPSCSLFPQEFFRRSVTLLLTTIKTPLEFKLGQCMGDRIYDVVDRHYIAISPLNGL